MQRRCAKKHSRGTRSISPGVLYLCAMATIFSCCLDTFFAAAGWCAATHHRQPEPPQGLEEFEQHVVASNAPAVVPVDRALIRAPAGALRGGSGRRLQQMSLNTSLGSLGEFEFGKGWQQARRRPALTIGTFGSLPQLGHGGQTQFPQQQRQASGIDGDAFAHATAPVVAHAVAAIAGTNTS
jgi:hypothetical protein